MNKFPVTIIDNFYENPDLVRNFALSLPYHDPPIGQYPGSRTGLLSVENDYFFRVFTHKLFSLFFDFETTKLMWSVETNFQKINSFSSNGNDIKNSGWIHSDNDTVFSGIIYLNPNPKPGWGTSIYKLKSKEIDNCIQKTKFLHYSKSEDFDQKEHEIEKKFNNDKFVETIRVENVYNRLLLFEGGVYHGVPTYYSEDEDPRLTQVFFVYSLNTSSQFPIVRSRTSFDFDPQKFQQKKT